MNISAIASRSVTLAQSEGGKDFASHAPMVSVSETISAVATEDAAASKIPSAAQVNQAVKQVNDAFAQKGQNLYASLEKDKETGIHVVKLLDKNTKEVVSQYPSKEIVAIAAAITQYQESKGQLLDTNA